MKIGMVGSPGTPAKYRGLETVKKGSADSAKNSETTVNSENKSLNSIKTNLKGTEKSPNDGKKILMIISYPDNRLKKEIESLKKNGYLVSLIIWDRSWPLQIDADITVKSLKLDTPVGNLKNIFYLPIWWTFIIFWTLQTKWDVIHTVNFDTYLVSILIAKLERKPIIYDIFDFYGDMTVKFLRPIITNLDKFILRFADGIIIADDSRIYQIGKNIKNLIVTINNTPEESIFIKNRKTINEEEYKGFNDDIKSIQDKFTYNEKGKDGEEFKIFIGGQIEEERGIYQIISAIKEIEGVELIVKGFCSEKAFRNRLFSLIKDTKNIDMDLNGVPYDEIIQNTLKADLTLALYDPSVPNNKYASPNKLFESMASEIPIIVNENTPMADIVEKEECGITVPYENKDAIKNAISVIKNNQELQKKLGYNGRKAYENKYTWTIMEKRLMGFYDQILNTDTAEYNANK